MGICGDCPGDAELFCRAAEGDRCARDALLRRHTGLVYSLCGRFPASADEREDLAQAGFLGLMQAIDGFDARRGHAFSTYAVPHVLGEMRKHLRGAGAVSISRRARKMTREVERKQEEMAARTGRLPALIDVAKALGLDPSEIALAQEALRVPVDLDDLHLASRRDPGQMEVLLTLKDAVAKLQPIHREIVQRRFFADQTQAEIARDLVRSQGQISRLQRKALLQLRHLLDEDG